MNNQNMTAGFEPFAACDGSGLTMLTVDELMVIFVAKGSINLYYNSTQTSIGKGSILLLNQGIHYLNYNESSLATVYIPFEDLERAIVILSVNYNITIDSNHICEKCRYHNFFVTKATPLLTALFESNKEDKQSVALLLFLLLCSDDYCLKSRLARAVNNRNNKFVQTVYNNIFNNSTVTTLANKTHRSLTAFKSAFHHHFHSSPHRWTTEQRLSRATALLSTTDLPISEVARTCSYTNLSHFTKRFKQLYHTTPTAYRKEHRKDNI